MDVTEILSTVMLNAIAIQIAFLLLRGPMIDPAELAAGTEYSTFGTAAQTRQICPALPIWLKCWVLREAR